MYWVVGGIYNDFTFNFLNQPDPDVYGPFGTYQDAYDVWKEHIWKNVDNALHKLKIISINDPSSMT